MQIFKVDTIENFGDNWLIADFGVDSDDNQYILTTDHVHASELHQYSGGAKADAELVCRLLHEHYGSGHADYPADEWFALSCRQREEISELRRKNRELQAKLEDLHDKYAAAQDVIDQRGQQIAAYAHMLGTSEQTADAQWVDAQTEVIARLKQRIAELEGKIIKPDWTQAPD